MLILGHPLIPYTPLHQVSNVEQIKKTEPNSILLIDFNNKKLIEYALSQNINLALQVQSIKDACLANALGAKFILVDKSISKAIQKLANEYLFDSKIILYIKDENGIEDAAENFIDGVLFKEGIV